MCISHTHEHQQTHPLILYTELVTKTRFQVLVIMSRFRAIFPTGQGGGILRGGGGHWHLIKSGESWDFQLSSGTHYRHISYQVSNSEVLVVLIISASSMLSDTDSERSTVALVSVVQKV